ncbi:MAG TPA: HD domain-containing protein [Candidatus Marinimicrobia bacterium]|jgi:response regulator RpfG family c-di-GMP phosphodiesterase|nr:HD domain-containing protein [Candidatus Neomarinimicrobiota bacterium]
MSNRSQRFENLLQISHKLNYTDDIDSVLERILTEARSLTESEAGTIYLRYGDELVFEHTQNDLLFTSNLDNKNNYFSQRIPVTDSSIAGFVALNSLKGEGKDTVLNFPDVYDLSNTYPFQFDKSFDTGNDYRTKSLLATSIDNVNGENIGVIQLINKKGNRKQSIQFDKDDETVLSSFADLAAVHIERARITKEMILRMIKMAELRDPKETGAHVNRVGAYSAELYEHWAIKNGISEKEIKKVKGDYRMASMLHDVGKVGISDTILKKPGLFNDEERQIMKNHTIYGTELFKYAASDMDKLASEISISHHENWDGTGYPGSITHQKGYVGENIPLSGRIVRITDVYDALISVRCYKEAWKEQDVLDEIDKKSGIEFDPFLVTCFFDIYETIKNIQVKYEEEGS